MTEKITLKIEGMDCAGCAATVEKGLSKLNGIKRADVNFATGKAAIEYDPKKVNLLTITKTISKFGYKVKTEQVSFEIADMHCPDCGIVLERALSDLDGVISASASFVAKKATIYYIPDKVGIQAIKKTVEKTGSKPVMTVTEKEKILKIESLRRIVSIITLGLFILLNFIGNNYGIDWITRDPVFGVNYVLIATLICGYPIFKGVFYAFMSKTLNRDVLISLATFSALAIGEYMVGGEVILLMAMADELESLTIGKTRKAIRSLIDTTPKTVRVRRNGKEAVIEVEKVERDDTVIIKPGETIPVDGVVISGRASVNQAPLTGESIPVEKKGGDKVFAGTINELGALEVRAVKIGESTTVAKITKLVEEAQTVKAPIQTTSDRFAGWFIPLVIVISALVFVITRDIIRSISVLVIACPCAFALATPTAVVAGIGNAAKKGVLIKGGVYLEEMGKVDALMLDKTGTLTLGKPKVTDVISLGGKKEREILKLAATAEKMSEHPLASAILERADELKIRVPSPEKFRVIPGQGVIARHKNKKITVGNRKLFRNSKVTFVKNIEEKIDELENEGKTVIRVAVNRHAVGLIAVADILRHIAPQAISRLKKEVVKKVIMLTGDNERTAQAIAKQVGIEDVHADLLPEEKLKKINNFKKGGFKTAMIGDGINDAPALAAADVGIAMGVAGSDVAIETADVALMTDNLLKVVDLIKISRRTIKTIHQNLIFSVIFNIVGITMATSGLLGPALAIIGHNISSFTVVLNSVRLLRYDPQKK